jgi:hypothetical protein
MIPVLRILLEHSALTHIISHLCDYSLGIYDCAQIFHKPDTLPMDKCESTLYYLSLCLDTLRIITKNLRVLVVSGRTVIPGSLQRM